MDMTNNLVIADNRAGAYLGNKSAHGRIANNLFSQNRGAIWAYAQSDVVIENNVFYDEKGPGVGFHDTCNLTIRRNSFVNNEQGLARYSQEGKPPGIGARTNGNHFWNNKEDFVNFDKEASALYGDPKFTDASKGDFSLQKDSPLLDKEGKPLAGLSDPEPIRALRATWATLNQ
jgi:nitrous oxidase accessory protein NosD